MMPWMSSSSSSGMAWHLSRRGERAREESADPPARDAALDRPRQAQVVHVVGDGGAGVGAVEDLRGELVLADDVLEGLDVAAPAPREIDGGAPDDVHARAGEVDEVVDVVLPAPVVVALEKQVLAVVDQHPA